MGKKKLKKTVEAYNWLCDHPIFKGKFDDQFYYAYIADAVHGKKDIPKVLMEISIYQWDKILDSDKKSWISFADDSFDVWEDSFEDGIIKLAKKVKKAYGDYTYEQYWDSRYELKLGVKPGSKKAKKERKKFLKNSKEFLEGIKSIK